ncbi:MAG: ATP-binding protein [Anaerolineae bacterium]|nr:ATP-binding protein [Anaerolineae bacterium]
MNSTEATTLYQTIFEKSATGMIALRRDGPERFTVVAINPMATVAGRWSFPYDSILGQNILDEFPGMRESGMFAIYHQVLDEQETVHLEELDERSHVDKLDAKVHLEGINYDNRVHKDNFFDISFIPLDADHLLIAFTNITERVNLRRELTRTNEALKVEIKERKRAQEELARSNQELEQFAYVASHDLQEPLRMVKSYVQFLAADYKGQLDADADRFINYAVDGANRMATLIDDLLAFSRVGTQGKPFQPTNCNAVLEEIMADLTAVIDEGQAQVTWDSLPTVTADRSQLTQLLRNLVSNGIKYRGEAPPRVHIAAELAPAAADMGETEGSAGEEWRFSVRDNGIGIAPEHYERIFLMFKRLHHRSEYPGTGIGLAICQKIVERHGGRIWVESEPGNGSIFYFTLPNMKKEASKMAQGKSEGEATNSLEVLLVEDNPGDVEITRRILAGSKFDVNMNVAEDGEVAMAYLRQEGEFAHKPGPDLILLDLNMPKKDGYQVLEELRADPALQELPVMVLTSTAAERENLYEQGIRPNSFCKKPLDLFQFDHFAGQLGSEVVGALATTSEPQPPLPAPQPDKPAEEAKRWWWPF